MIFFSQGFTLLKGALQCTDVSMRLSKIWVTTTTRSVEKILAAKKVLQPPTTLVPKIAGIQQLSNNVCHDVGPVWNEVIGYFKNPQLDSEQRYPTDFVTIFENEVALDNF